MNSKNFTEKYEGIWYIYEMELWDEDYFNMDGQAFIIIEKSGLGGFQFGLVSGEIDGDVFKEGKIERFEFDWEGQDELDPVSGSGWIKLKGKDIIEGSIKIHRGDRSAFKAQRQPEIISLPNANTINEKNYKHILFGFTANKYKEKIVEFYSELFDEFPYKTDMLDDIPEDVYTDNFLSWLVFEKPLPETGKTIVEEYVEENPDLDDELKQKILMTQNVINSRFKVKSKKKLDIELEDLDTQKLYHVALENDSVYLERNAVITARIHPFGDVYKLLGVFLVDTDFSPFSINPDDLLAHYSKGMIKEAEEQKLHAKSKMTPILNKYPSQWVDGICENIGLSSKGKKNIKVKEIAAKVKSDLEDILMSLPKKSLEALKLVLYEGGYVKYGKLKKYNDEVSYWWKEEPPTSTIGLLRLSALLAVGVMDISGRMYKVALIPSDIREDLENIL